MTHRTVALSFIVLCLILCPGCATTAPNADTTTKQGQTKANEVVEPVEKQAAAEAQGVEKQPDAAEQHSTGTTLGQPKQLSAHERHPLDIKGVSGLSGLTTDGQGHLWAVSERDLTLLQIHEQKVVKQVKIDMKGEAMDFESITWLSDNRFALGTERDSERREDNVIILELNDSGAVEKSRRRVSYDEAGGPAAKNRGLEAICALDTATVLVGSEKVVERSGARMAPIWRLDLETGKQVQTWLTLASDKGKLAGMACRATKEGFEAIAIERHFGVMRILSFAIPAQGLPADPITPTLRTDLAGHLEGNPNLEGLSFGQGSSVWLVVDNAYGRITGPNEVIRIPTL